MDKTEAKFRLKRAYERSSHKTFIAILAFCAVIKTSSAWAQALGGGEGYGDWVNAAQADYYVDTKAGLETALANAVSGQVIYVDDAAEINMSGEWDIPIPEGVTLASGRGRNGSLGGKLFTNTEAKENFLKIMGPGVRITGLRIEGPTIEADSSPGQCQANEPNGVYVGGTIEWKLLSGTNKTWSTLTGADDAYIAASNLATGDFNGDGVTDLFRSTGTEWRASYGGISAWTDLASYSYLIKNLGFGDFDGDGDTDVFRGNGTTWQYWDGVIWHDLADSNYTAQDLGFGDFNGDGVTDVFRGTGSTWVVSWGGATAWNDLADSAYMVKDLAFGDFNGDGITDVFRGTGSTWVVSWGGATAWNDLADSEYMVKDLAFGDYNGDGKTDVFRATGTKWRISWGGATAWEDFVTSSDRKENLLFGDFNGDGTADVLVIKGRDYSLEIDNNELWGWPSAAISINLATNARVHHNHIHHNKRVENDCAGGRRFGYGVTQNMSQLLIENNLFDHNRHDIAGTGRPGSSYEARFNLSAEGLISHSFDMHGCNDRPTDAHCLNNVDVSGTRVHIEDNIFLQDSQKAVVIRGIPEDVAYIANNKFADPNLWATSETLNDGALFQRYATGNLIQTGNTLNHSPSRWFIRYGGDGWWKYRRLSSLAPGSMAIGDFNGDGAQDMFRTSGGQWYVSSYGRDSWESIGNSSYTLADLAFGDFNGDGVTDVFRPNGTNWYVSWGGDSGWQQLSASSYMLANLAFGDFNGDDVTDVFRPNGTNWYVSWGGDSGWQQLLASGYMLENLAFGDFNGDGETDVFRANGTKWYVSMSGASGWQVLRDSTITLASLRFCDFNGDGETDVFRVDGSAWYVSYSGTGAWTQLHTPGDSAAYALESLAFGDFNGDKACDVVVKR